MNRTIEERQRELGEERREGLARSQGELDLRDVCFDCKRRTMAEGKPMRMSETWEKNSDPNYHVLAWMAAKGPPEPESYLDRVRAEKRSEEPAEIIAHYAHDVRKSILMKNPYLRMSYRAPDDPVVKKPMPDVFLGKIKSDVTQGFEIGYARSYS